MSPTRYAIYLAPPPDTLLWAFGSHVLGYDASTGKDVPGFSIDGFNASHWRELTEKPRTYGFHATLKAPFRLSDGRSILELEEALFRFSLEQKAFDLGPLAAQAIMQGNAGFVALTPLRDSPALATLERQVVSDFDPFRAPLTNQDILKRQVDMLTGRQRESLERFGYPYIGPDYRFHMTLTGNIADTAAIADKLADVMANDIGAAHFKVDALVLFRQERADERFQVMRRFDLRGA